MTLFEPIGQPVRSLQQMLRTISHADEDVLPVVPDGIYGSDTMASVSSFQQKHGLPLSGIVDIETWYAVADEFRKALVEVAQAEPVSPVLQPRQVIRLDEINEHLYMMHGMLRTIADHYPTMPSPPYGNVLNEDSAAAVRWLQTRAGLPVTGEIDRQTWRVLAKLYRITVGDGTVPDAEIENKSENA